MNSKNAFKLLGSLLFLLMLPVSVVLVQSAVKYFSKASEIPANLVVDMSTDYGASPDAWRNLAQGGEERGRMLAPVISEVRSLRPEYIRIDHVFDFYDQSQLDEVIGDITSTGAKPFIALSYMDNVWDNWPEWETKVKNLIEHVSGRNGLAITDVYYEVWNEPDLFGGFKIGGAKNYLDLYLHTANAASRVSNSHPFKLGGPATTGYYQNWMKGLLGFVNTNNLKLDFLSWHDYSKDLDSYLKDTNGARSLLVDYNLDGQEMMITEMGPNSENDPVYDNNFGAIHTLATAVILQGEVSKAFNFEIKDGPGPEKYWGRWGIFTHEKFGAPEKKPRGLAIDFLNNMIGGRKVNVLGQGSWIRAIAKRLDNNITRILIVNYDPKGIHEEAVPIKLVNLKSQNFILKKTEFLGVSDTQEITTSSTEWETTQYLKPNSAMLFEITYR